MFTIINYPTLPSQLNAISTKIPSFRYPNVLHQVALSRVSILSLLISLDFPTDLLPADFSVQINCTVTGNHAIGRESKVSYILLQDTIYSILQHIAGHRLLSPAAYCKTAYSFLQHTAKCNPQFPDPVWISVPSFLYPTAMYSLQSIFSWKVQLFPFLTKKLLLLALTAVWCTVLLSHILW